MDGKPTFPAGSRRARVVLLAVGAVVLAATAVGVRAVLGAPGGHDRQPGEAAEVASADVGTTVGGQVTGATVAGGGGAAGGPAATGAGTSSGASGGTGGASGGTGKGGTPRTTTSRPTTTQATSTTLPQIVIQGANWAASESCYQGSDGVWHYVMQFHVTVDSIGTGTVRYQWGRGADDARSEVKTYDIPVQYAFMTVHVKLDDTIKGTAASPTETVVDRLHVLAPPDLNGKPFTATMTHTICP